MLTKLNPDARAVKTSINLVPAGTLIFKPVNIPLEIVPIEITPVSEGVNVTVVPGTTVIVLFGAIDSYNFASIVIVLPTNDNAAVVEKNTSIEVMTPSLGIVKAKFVNVPDGLVKSIVLPMIDIPGAELPNPINAGVPTKPPAFNNNIRCIEMFVNVGADGEGGRFNNNIRCIEIDISNWVK